MKRIAPEYEFSEEQLNIVKSIAKESNLLEDTVKILYGRGICDRDSIISFISPSRKHFISPFKMSGMDEAVKLITKARNEGWVVVVYGDYDADGVCASTIMRSVLKDFGIDPIVYIPERRDGYGLNKASIDLIFEEYFPQLFITVDCGISGAEEVEYIKEQGAKVIVTDHHELPQTIPDCICINPKFNDGYIYDNLCGAGVALKVGVALNGDDAYKYLDFAAIATVADSVPLTGENRDIVYEGLKLINRSPRKCYSHFLNKGDEKVTAQTISFGIAPKINAAGRMGDARSALDLFSEEDENKIFDLATKLTAYNQERQKCCDELYLSAKEKLKEKGAYGKVIMLWDESWNTGFVGIVAARLSDEYARPALLFVRNGDMLKGSARSVESVNIFEALKSSSEIITEFGGHAQAAGVNIKVDDFDELEKRLNDYLSSNYTPEDFEPTLYICGNLTSPFNARLAKEIEMLEPFGVGNKRPMFEVDEGALEVKPVKALSTHVTAKSKNIELLYFGGSKFTYLMESRAPKKFIFSYNVNVFRGKEYIKGTVAGVVCERDAGAECAEEIALNNILLLACPEINCEKEYRTTEQIDALLSASGGFGTVCLASSYDTLKRFKNIDKFAVDLFRLSSGNLADTVIISAQTDVDLSGFKNIIFLEKPPCGVRLASLAGKKVIINSEISGGEFLKGLSTDREQLLKIYQTALPNVAKLSGSDSAEVAKKCALGEPVQTAFALEIFRQLSLISYEGEKINVFRGIKTQLTNSELYNIVKDYENGIR